MQQLKAHGRAGMTFSFAVVLSLVRLFVSGSSNRMVCSLVREWVGVLSWLLQLLGWLVIIEGSGRYTMIILVLLEL